MFVAEVQGSNDIGTNPNEVHENQARCAVTL